VLAGTEQRIGVLPGVVEKYSSKTGTDLDSPKIRGQGQLQAYFNKGSASVAPISGSRSALTVSGNKGGEEGQSSSLLVADHGGSSSLHINRPLVAHSTSYRKQTSSTRPTVSDNKGGRARPFTSSRRSHRHCL
jgi:hypothetical protein